MGVAGQVAFAELAARPNHGGQDFITNLPVFYTNVVPNMKIINAIMLLCQIQVCGQCYVKWNKIKKIVNFVLY